MAEFFASGRAVDVVLAVLLLEALILRWRGSGWATILLLLLPAVLMMIAVRAAITDMDWIFVALPLAASFPVHLADLYRRGLIGRSPHTP